MHEDAMERYSVPVMSNPRATHRLEGFMSQVLCIKYAASMVGQ